MNHQKPAHYHKLKGTYRSDRHGDYSEDPCAVVFPNPPGWLSQSAAEQWLNIRAAMESTGVIRQADFSLMCMYCELFAEFQECPREFSAAKYAQLRGAGAELYLSSSSRSKLAVSFEAEPDKDNPFAQFV